MTRHKKRIVKAAVAVLLILLVCTIAARTVDTLLLPQVTPQTMRSGNLQYTTYCSGVVTGAVNTTEVLAQGNWLIRDILVEENAHVNEGDVLFVLDAQEYRIRLTQLEAAIQQQKNSINGYPWSPGDELVMQTELRALQLQYTQARNAFPARGEVLAPATGVITQIAGPGNVTTGQMLGVIDTGAGESALELRLSPTDAKQVLSKGATLTCTFNEFTNAQDFVLEETEAKARVTSAEYEAETGQYLIRAAILTETPVTMGTPVRVRCIMKSREYSMLVPLACVMTDSDGAHYIMIMEDTTSIWGIETIVRKHVVDVLESDATTAAISMQVGGVSLRLAAYPTRALEDGETVRVIEK